MATPACPLCESAGGDRVFADLRLRVVLPDEPDHPGFTRVIWRAHVAEMTDLAPADRGRLLDAVLRVEQVMRDVLAPDKVNLASLGNQVPHLHWHVIPRWRDDRHFPGTVWAPPAARDPALAAARRGEVESRISAYRAALAAAFDDPGDGTAG